MLCAAEMSSDVFFDEDPLGLNWLCDDHFDESSFSSDPRVEIVLRLTSMEWTVEPCSRRSHSGYPK
jgi:hypothetical protein